MLDELFHSNMQAQKKEPNGSKSNKLFKSPKSSIRESAEMRHSSINLEPSTYLNSKYEQLNSIEIPELVEQEEGKISKSKAKLVKFNDKVRKANLKQFKKSKSKHRRNSKNKNEDGPKIGSRNSSLNQLRERVNKMPSQSRKEREDHSVNRTMKFH